MIGLEQRFEGFLVVLAGRVQVGGRGGRVGVGVGGVVGEESLFSGGVWKAPYLVQAS